MGQLPEDLFFISPSTSRLHRKEKQDHQSVPSPVFPLWSGGHLVTGIGVFLHIGSSAELGEGLQTSRPLEPILLKRSRLEVNLVQTKHQQCLCIDSFPRKKVQMSSYNTERAYAYPALSYGLYPGDVSRNKHFLKLPLSGILFQQHKQ